MLTKNSDPLHELLYRSRLMRWLERGFDNEFETDTAIAKLCILASNAQSRARLCDAIVDANLSVVTNTNPHLANLFFTKLVALASFQTLSRTRLDFPNFRFTERQIAHLSALVCNNAARESKRCISSGYFKERANLISGKWLGFFTMDRSLDIHGNFMELTLDLKGNGPNVIYLNSIDATDDVGRFSFKGKLHTDGRKSVLRKQYIGQHSWDYVSYPFDGRIVGYWGELANWGGFFVLWPSSLTK